MKLSHVLCAAGLVIGVAACGGGPDAVDPTDTAASAAEALPGDSGDAADETGADDGTDAVSVPRERAAPAELPSTASPLPLAGLAGLLALAGGVAVRMLRG